MRKITQQAVKAFYSVRELGTVFNKDNTVVQASLGLRELKLHGHTIAKLEHGKLFVDTCGYPTNTTKERLNGLPGVKINTVKGQLHLNNLPWDGNLICVTTWGQ